MRVFNYSNYAKTIEIGISNPNMTKIATNLFEPIINMPYVLNQKGNPYHIDAKQAKAWYDQSKEIPGAIKSVVGNADVIDATINHFSENILDTLINPLQESEMYSKMRILIRDSDLQENIKEELLQLYSDGDNADFLAKSFLYSIVGDNLKQDPDTSIVPIAEDIRIFKELVKKNHKKPVIITPPNEIEDHEIGYVSELYKVYGEKTGEEYARPEDLQSHPKLVRNFNNQRKSYYSAETIRRELRDTITLDESDSFDILKDEMYDGVIETCDRDFEKGYDRMTSVLEHATQVSISHNLEDRLLDWVGAGEKKGICHMLVNDERIKWMEDDEDEQ
jgi:hypothetical protein